MQSQYRVFKFGGASVKDAAGLQNVTQILTQAFGQGGTIVVVVSAMGKTTNLLEAILKASNEDAESQLAALIAFHKAQAGLTLNNPTACTTELEGLHLQMQAALAAGRGKPFDEAYDQFVSFGEVLSSCLLFAVVQEAGLPATLLDARRLVKTDSTFRAPQVNLPLSLPLLKQEVGGAKKAICILQGFIGSDDFGRTTTLGREGSDYTAALCGAALQAQSVTVWKDVPGVLNADPKRLPEAKLLPSISYAEAAEMTFYGATVLHPKTLKPLAEAGIPLFVRSFIDPTLAGTCIGHQQGNQAANIFLQQDQVAMLHCKSKDLSFISELYVARLLQTAHQVGLRVLTLQASALDLKLVVLQDFGRAAQFASLLQQDYEVTAAYDLTLATFMHADPAFVSGLLAGKDVLLQQQVGTTHWALMGA